VAAAIGEQPGVAISDTTITPRDAPDRKYSDVTIPALQFRVTDRHTYDPTHLMVRLLVAIKQVHPNSFAVTRTGGFDRLAGSDRLRLALEEGRPADGIIASWAEGLESFAGTREKYLIYR
jgi:uncharacterized protein YbbC (DUF1343 family)